MLARDAKLAKLREMIEQKCRHPINAGNRKIIVFTAFSDTAQYLYANLAPWAKATWALMPPWSPARRHPDHAARPATEHEQRAVGLRTPRQGAPGRHGR
jgi:hypothetical protein